MSARDGSTKKRDGWRVDRSRWAYDRSRATRSSPPHVDIGFEGIVGGGGYDVEADRFSALGD